MRHLWEQGEGKEKRFLKHAKRNKHFAHQNNVTSKTTMSHVQFVTCDPAYFF